MASSSNQSGKNKAVSTSKPGGQKYGLSWIDDFHMVDDESVVDQAYKIFRMIADDAKSFPQLHYVLNDKEELVNVIIEKLPESWKDYAATLKDMQMQKELSFGALVNHLRVEEEEKRAQHQKVEFVKEDDDTLLPSKISSPIHEISELGNSDGEDNEPDGNDDMPLPPRISWTNEEKKTEDYNRSLALYKAALRGDWDEANKLFDEDPGALTAPINEFSETALFVAAVRGRNTNEFVRMLVDKKPSSSVDEACGSVLNWAAYVGNTEAVKAILSKNPSLIYYRADNIDCTYRSTPLTRAATNGKRDTLLYLLELVKNDEDSSKLFPDEDSAAALMDETIRSGYYDIALYLVKNYSAFRTPNNSSFGLQLLATKAASAFKSDTHYQWWQRIIYTHVPVKLDDCIISFTRTVSVENPVGIPTQTVLVESPTQTVSVENPVGSPTQTVSIESPTQTVSVENPIGNPTQTVSVENPTQTVSFENPVGSPTQTVSVENPVDNPTQTVSVERPTLTVSVENPVGNPTQTVSVENPVDNRDQVMGLTSYIWAPIHMGLTSYIWAATHFEESFGISVANWIKHIQKQKEMHLQTLELVKCFCKRIASLPDSAKHSSLAHDAILSAARNGIPEIVHEIVESFPDLLWTLDSTGRYVFEKAVLERQHNAFNLVHQMGEYSRELVLHQNDNTNNNILHLAGKLAPSTKLSQISGAALQMQLELQWFEAVKKLMSPRDIDKTNDGGKTPAMIFTEEHKELVAEGEKWMKDTANSCTIPAALIVTIVFAAAITVPGGIHGTNGIPILYKEVVFNIFAVSDAISLFTSTTSLLVFLSILTSRYAERDFLFVLPNRLIIGLFTLFLSITAMLIAFSCAIYLLFGNKAWILYPVAGLACVPIISFASLQYPLLRDLMKSTYGQGIFGKQSEDRFYN